MARKKKVAPYEVLVNEGNVKLVVNGRVKKVFRDLAEYNAWVDTQPKTTPYEKRTD